MTSLRPLRLAPRPLAPALPPALLPSVPPSRPLACLVSLYLGLTEREVRMEEWLTTRPIAFLRAELTRRGIRCVCSLGAYFLYYSLERS